LLTFR